MVKHIKKDYKTSDSRKRWWSKRIGILVGIATLLGLALWVSEAYLARKWDGRQRFTIVELNEPLTILSFDPATAEGIKVTLPDNLIIETVGGRGKWKAGVMSQTAKKFGKVWASDSVCDYLSIPCTALAADLSWFDKFMWWKWGREVRWTTVELSETQLVKEIEAVDGEKESVLTPNWGSKAYDWFASGSIVRENLNVTVVNATKIAGLGSHVAKMVETAGMKVVMVKNSDEKIEKCRIEAIESNQKTLGVIWMEQKFGCGVEIGQAQEREVIVNVGEEYAKWLLGDD